MSCIKPNITKSINVNEGEVFGEKFKQMRKEIMLGISTASSNTVYYGGIDSTSGNILTSDSLEYVKFPDFGTLSTSKEKVDDKS